MPAAMPRTVDTAAHSWRMALKMAAYLNEVDNHYGCSEAAEQVLEMEHGRRVERVEALD